MSVLVGEATVAWSGGMKSPHARENSYLLNLQNMEVDGRWGVFRFKRGDFEVSW